MPRPTNIPFRGHHAVAHFSATQPWLVLEKIAKALKVAASLLLASQHNRLAVDREALRLDPPGGSRNRGPSHRPVIRVAAVKPDRGTISADDHPIAVMFDFVNPVGADRRLLSFNRLSGDDESGRERIDFHCREKIGRRDAGNNRFVVRLSPLALAVLGEVYQTLREGRDELRNILSGQNQTLETRAGGKDNFLSLLDSRD
jgi:hypothetical protein